MWQNDLPCFFLCIRNDSCDVTHVANENVWSMIQDVVHDDLLTMMKKRKLRWFGPISRSSGMVKTVLQGQSKEQK